MRLPFASSVSITSEAFALVHCNVWMSLALRVTSIIWSCLQSFLLDQVYGHAASKIQVYGHFVDFIAYVQTHFGSVSKCFQTDNGTVFANNAMSSFLTSRDILLRLSYPYTSHENGKAERMLCALLIHASMPRAYWVEALATATYVLNRSPSSSVGTKIPYQLLHRSLPEYSHLRVFGCLCYPNLSATTPHKLVPRSAPCVFLGYPSSNNGYRCLDISTRRVIISRHVMFIESVFSFTTAPYGASSLDFLL